MQLSQCLGVDQNIEISQRNLSVYQFDNKFGLPVKPLKKLPIVTKEDIKKVAF